MTKAKRTRIRRQLSVATWAAINSSRPFMLFRYTAEHRDIIKIQQFNI